ncbi:hypothetical protein PHLCEN_2v12508 [Hermanssonia centrifuga]|uniref:Uncharacterized protein n=1 Tax=Hermanssonia centrifuga TaxID=98765 RepID=A0A2R6NGZ5_9APHY|nr:hypothetical protein PHLCEN_2v12508 [Hermanssonia centrifuga]
MRTKFYFSSITPLPTGISIAACSVTSTLSESALTNAPPILMSRFILNLRQVNESANSNDDTLGNFSQFSAPAFRIPASVAGNLGEPLGYDTDPASTEDDSFELDSQPRESNGVDLEDGESPTNQVE